MRQRYPEIEPYRSGHLDVGDGHLLYWEECGNPNGKPALILHGGPGSGCTPGNRRYYDPAVYRMVLFDQRNCGRSLPHASDPEIDLSVNTTHHLIADIELLRGYLNIDRWLIQGASWGSVLALAYAERNPTRVSELILISMGTGRRMETDLLTTGLARLFPLAWGKLTEATGGVEGVDVIDRAHRLLFSQDAETRRETAKRWCDWETAILPTQTKPSPRFDSAEFRLCFARIVTHYWRNGSWLHEGEVLGNAHRLAGIPGAILQGRLDLSNLSGSPWELASRWPGCDLVFIEEAGHEGSPTFNEKLLEYTSRYEGVRQSWARED